MEFTYESLALDYAETIADLSEEYETRERNIKEYLFKIVTYLTTKYEMNNIDSDLLVRCLERVVSDRRSIQIEAEIDGEYSEYDDSLDITINKAICEEFGLGFSYEKYDFDQLTDEQKQKIRFYNTNYYDPNKNDYCPIKKLLPIMNVLSDTDR